VPLVQLLQSLVQLVHKAFRASLAQLAHKESKAQLAQQVQSVQRAQLVQQAQLPQLLAQQVQQERKDSQAASMITKSKPLRQLVTQVRATFFTTTQHK
jgi:hypothetical protein